MNALSRHGLDRIDYPLCYLAENTTPACKACAMQTKASFCSRVAATASRFAKLLRKLDDGACDWLDDDWL